MIPGRKTSENKADFLCALQENEKMKKWSDGVVTSICAKKRTYNSFREELAYLDVTF
jgi:hypothetical protein